MSGAGGVCDNFIEGLVSLSRWEGSAMPSLGENCPVLGQASLASSRPSTEEAGDRRDTRPGLGVLHGRWLLGGVGVGG